jgi:4'-phosphopantetheinyl transferase
MRGALSLWAGRAPAQWEFALNEYGKPHLANPPLNANVRFNLSHTNGLAVLALACNRELGVDVEYLGRKETNADIAERFFAPEEVLDFIAQPEHQKSARFLEYWTLKESYIKAIGMGLSCPLESFAFRPATATQPPALIRVDDPALRKQNWDVWQERVGTDHLIALCVQSNGEGRSEPILKHADWLLLKT